MKILSFGISGPHAAFKDPSSTSGQSVYLVPSKSALVGLVGAILGVCRPDDLKDLYGEEYVKLFADISVGLRVEGLPKKITFYSNRRSLKSAKTKPFKTEVAEKPSYVAYVAAGRRHGGLEEAVRASAPAFPPYLGHAYCPATVTWLASHDGVAKAALSGATTRCVVPDGSETYNGIFKPSIAGEGSVVIERHRHHFLSGGRLDGRVLRYWIPVSGAALEINEEPPGGFAKFYDVGDDTVCLF